MALCVFATKAAALEQQIVERIITDYRLDYYFTEEEQQFISYIVIMPLQPFPYDIWAANEVVNLIKEISESLERIKVLLRICVKIFTAGPIVIIMLFVKPNSC
jgi:hypothetical protein